MDANATLQQQISMLSSDMHTLLSALRERVDQVEKGLEQKIINKVIQVLDKRINSELNRLHKDIDTKMDTMKKNIREEIKSDLDLVHSKIDLWLPPITLIIQPEIRLIVTGI
ncbi:hypothetical protein DPMN_042079 [Dreissena polymorpha]|uniref:Uncharacterized protein n=1 Tax=Dreissena polymorpha TaxID=45954 RepID=A0A9D4D1C5_DREPO|nr:hypothetical protein DPMN_042079 [Dreissena polymorpha]